MKITRQQILVGGLVLAALIIGSWVVRLFPNTEELLRKPFEHPATLGESVKMRTVEAKVTGVLVAESLADASKRVYETTGKFVIVQYQAIANTAAQPIPYGRLIDSKGRIFGGRSYASAACGTGQPGIIRACEAIFEVPADATGFTFRLPTEVYEDQDDVLVVTLGEEPPALAEHSMVPGRTLGAPK